MLHLQLIYYEISWLIENIVTLHKLTWRWSCRDQEGGTSRARPSYCTEASTDLGARTHWVSRTYNF